MANAVVRVTPVQLSVPGLKEPLNLVLLPDGSYEIEQRSIASAAGYESDKPIRHLLTKDQGFESRHKLLITEAQTLAGKRFEIAPKQKPITTKFQPQKRQVEGKPRTSNTYPLVFAVLCWQYWAEKGNAKCAALIGALAIEALEKRADEVTGIQRTEEERDELLADNIKLIEGVHYELVGDLQEAHLTKSGIEEVKSFMPTFSDEDLLMAGIRPSAIAYYEDVMTVEDWQDAVNNLKLISDVLYPQDSDLARSQQARIEADSSYLDVLKEVLLICRFQRQTAPLDLPNDLEKYPVLANQLQQFAGISGTYSSQWLASEVETIAAH